MAVFLSGRPFPYASREATVRPMRGLTDKVVVVVGGATGLGAATAARLAAEGSSVVIGDIAHEAAQRTAERIVAAGGTATALACDLADPHSVGELMRAAESA